MEKRIKKSSAMPTQVFFMFPFLVKKLESPRKKMKISTRNQDYVDLLKKSKRLFFPAVVFLT
jgi:hypothetical protein